MQLGFRAVAQAFLTPFVPFALLTSVQTLPSVGSVRPTPHHPDFFIQGPPGILLTQDFRFPADRLWSEYPLFSGALTPGPVRLHPWFGWTLQSLPRLSSCKVNES